MDSTARTTHNNTASKMSSIPSGVVTEGATPASSPVSGTSLAMAAPKFGTLVPNRIFVGGISANTSEAELAQLFSAYGNVKATKIIADKGGVSKGYGFVTFETEEEAKRLQQESECIILRERKLNIAPAIKKQPFNRSFDGGTGSPPSVPSGIHYYTNGVGIPYQNGMTFYNTGALPPGSGMAPPTDPSLYQAAGVFGPQAATTHQTFAPVMYPVPAPSLYMPQQYQYSPIPYEPYYAGSAANSTPQYVYATNNSPSAGSSNGATSGNNSTGTGASSSSSGPQSSLASIPPPPFAAHFYATPAGSHHHGMAGTTHPPPQMEHLYYSFTAGPPTGPHPAHGSIGLPSDQQLLLYPTELTNQTSESQINQQDDSHSSSSHSEQLQGETQTAQTTTQVTTDSSTPLMPLVPVKYPLPARYPNHYHHQQTHVNSQHGNPHINHHPELAEDCNGNPLQYRATYVYPSHQFYIPHHTPTTTYRTAAPVAAPHHPRGDQRPAPSLLPTPSLIPGPHSPSSRSLANKPKYLPPQYSRRHYGPNMVPQSYYVTAYPGRPQQNFAFHNNNNNNHHHNNTTTKVVSQKTVNNSNNNNDAVAEKKNPSPNPRSPTNSPPPNVSSPNPQVQSFYNNQSSQQRYHQQQPRSRYQSSSPSIRKPFGSNNQGNNNSVQRQSKYKINGIVQSNGGAGDAGRGLPMTPPATPRGSGTGSESQLNETCHQMQALGL